VAQRNEAVKQRNIALSRQLLTNASDLQESQSDASLLLNAQALRMAPAAARDEARFALMNNLDRPYHVASRLTGHSGPVWGVAFSPDGKLLATASADKTVRLWEVETRQPLGQPLYGHADRVDGVAFSPNGKLLATASNDKTVRLWDVATGKPHGKPLTGHTDWVIAVAFSPDGKLLASSSADKTVRLWDLEGKALVADACTTANRNLSKGEWGRFVGPEFDYVRACPNAPSWLPGR
jgi:WD40 repeat protein